MKKKILFILIIFIFFISGCTKNNEKSVVNHLNKKINKLSSYQLEGNLQITNNDYVYDYDISVYKKSSNFYKIVMVNLSNNYTQIILKNDDGVYVVTPSINKSFKFQSDWPYNNSQIYLLDSLLNDINKSNKRTFKKVNKFYVLNTCVEYPNNKNLVNQSIKIDNKYNIKYVTVFDKNGIEHMKMNFKKIKYNCKINSKIFSLNDVISEFKFTFDEKIHSNKLEDNIYPFSIPNGTKLIDETSFIKETGNRKIMNFNGTKPFLLIEESVNIPYKFTVVPTMGEPYILNDVVGVISDKSINWISNDIEYYLTSDNLSSSEMINIAKSIVSFPIIK